MFENLSDRLERSFKILKGEGKITEINVAETLKDVRRALLDADVNYKVAKSFTDTVKQKAMGMNVLTAVKPSQLMVKIVHDELAELMGGKAAELKIEGRPGAPAIILMSGLQGSGKTTFSGKLANLLKTRNHKKPLLVACDVYRPAAIQQLHVVGESVGVPVYSEPDNKNVIEIANHAIQEAKAKANDVVIIDTAGRLAVDEEMMNEVKRLHALTDPIETFFTVDAMTGQDAANTAKAFGEALDLTGVILTKADGDARGGAALSVKEITGKPIKFIGLGEKIVPLEPFHPDRIASRILDMGDVLSLIEDLQRNTDMEQAKKVAQKIKSGEGFTFDDFRDQIAQMKKMGGMSGLLDKLPGMGNISDQLKDKVNDKSLLHMEAIINSMTKKERIHPEIIKGSRKKRIAMGAGVEIHEVNVLLRQFEMTQKMMKKMGKGGLRKMAGAMKGMMGQMGGMGGMGGMGNFFRR